MQGDYIEVGYSLLVIVGMIVKKQKGNAVVVVVIIIVVRRKVQYMKPVSLFSSFWVLHTSASDNTLLYPTPTVHLLSTQHHPRCRHCAAVPRHSRYYLGLQRHCQ